MGAAAASSRCGHGTKDSGSPKETERRHKSVYSSRGRPLGRSQSPQGSDYSMYVVSESLWSGSPICTKAEKSGARSRCSRRVWQPPDPE